MGFTVSGCAAGQGRLNAARLLGKLRMSGRDVNAIPGVWTPLGARLAETIERGQARARASAQYLRKLIAD
jgi:hypothetical protein